MPLVRQHFARSPISNPPVQLVVAQVQFQPLLGLADPTGVAPFQDAIRERFPRLSRMTSLEVSVGPEGVQARPSPGAGWALEDKDGEHRVLLDTNSISLETRKYGAYENMREAFI